MVFLFFVFVFFFGGGGGGGCWCVCFYFLFVFLLFSYSLFFFPLIIYFALTSSCFLPVCGMLFVLRSACSQGKTALCAQKSVCLCVNRDR